MLIKGDWLLCADGVTRPVVSVHVTVADGQRHRDHFLIDTGADGTVLSAGFLKELQLPARLPPTGLALSGIGGKGSYVVVKATLEFTRGDGGLMLVRGEFPAFTDPAATEMSILGRDVLDIFDLIVSRRRNAVLLLTGNHQYAVSG